MNSEKITFLRILDLDLPKRQSAFLFGPRKSGKTTFLKHKYPKSLVYDLLETKTYFKFLEKPWLLKEDILSKEKNQLKDQIIIDEIQKVPALLDEVHWLIENAGIGFILCGSSARKLRRGGVNLLGGRAWSYKLYPLCYPEFIKFTKNKINLLQIFKNGLLPSHYLSDYPDRYLESYVQDYLKEEIKAEGLVRNLQSFVRFLDAIAFTHGELTNYSNIARDCGVDAKTVKEYYQILVDTLIGFYVEPYSKKSRRSEIISMPKFYLFDVGVANHIAQKTINAIKGPEAGKSFEHYILMELRAYLGYKHLDSKYSIKFWRTLQGHYEVDFIITKLKEAIISIEVKIDTCVEKSDIKGLIAFQEENPKCTPIVVSQDERKRKMIVKEKIEITVYPYMEFLKDLWEGKII